MEWEKKIEATNGKVNLHNRDFIAKYSVSLRSSLGKPCSMEKTEKISVSIITLPKPATFCEVLVDLKTKTESICLTQNQICNFVANNYLTLISVNGATVFFFKHNSHLCCATIAYRKYNGSLVVRENYFDPDVELLVNDRIVLLKDLELNQLRVFPTEKEERKKLLKRATSSTWFGGISGVKGVTFWHRGGLTWPKMKKYVGQARPINFPGSHTGFRAYYLPEVDGIYYVPDHGEDGIFFREDWLKKMACFPKRNLMAIFEKAWKKGRKRIYETDFLKEDLRNITSILTLEYWWSIAQIL